MIIFWAHSVLAIRVEGAVRDPDQLHSRDLHPVHQLDRHLLLQEVNMSTDDTLTPDLLTPDLLLFCVI